MSGALRGTIMEASADEGVPLSELTVLAVKNDPFRVDTPAGHRNGAWFAGQLERLDLGDRQIHLRGVHYKLIGVRKPDGKQYTNTDPDWIWLQEKAADAARWLGYVPFAALVDKRNAAPVLRIFEPMTPFPYVGVGLDVDIPDADDLEPYVDVADFEAAQPYKLVFFGEKSSLEEVLGPISERLRADLYLPTGEISDTMLYTMARVGAEDGRPMIVFSVSDCDPAGWQMPISIGRKLQAFQAFEFPELEFQVRRVGLLPEQVTELGLPSTPLKPTEKRADDWTRAMGVEQTEIDALLALHPDLLGRLVLQAVQPFFDDSLASRVRAARSQWLEEAEAALAATLDPDEVDRIRSEAADKLAELEDQIGALKDALRVDASDLDLPEIVIPEPEVDESEADEPLVDSSWSWVEQTEALKASKRYER